MKRLSFYLVACVFLTLTGCGESFHGISDADHWTKELEKAKAAGDASGQATAEEALRALTTHFSEQVKDPNHREQSLAQLRTLKDPKSIPALLEVWKQDEERRQTIAGILGAIGETRPEASQQAGETLLSNLTEVPAGAPVAQKNKINRTNASIVTALGKMKYQPAAKKMVAYLGADDVSLASASAEALASMGYKEADAVDGLLKILKRDGQNWQSAKRIATAALGELRVAAAIPDLMLNLWKDQGRFYIASVDALFKIGSPAVQPLVDALGRKNQVIEDFAKAQNIGPGVIEAKSAEVLGDLEDPAAGPALLAFIEGLNKKLDKKDGALEQNEGRAVGIAAMSAGRSRNADIAAALAKASLVHRSQPAVYTNFALGLTYLGSKAAVPDLLTVAEDDKIEYVSWDSRVKAIEAASRLADADAGSKFAGLAERVAGEAIKASKGQITSKDQFPKWKEDIIEKNKKIGRAGLKPEERATIMKEVEEVRDVFVMIGFYEALLDAQARLEVAGKTKGDVKALADVLNNGKPAEQDRAAWDLGRSHSPEALDALLTKLQATAKLHKETKDKKVKDELNKIRQSLFFAIRLLAHDPALAKAKLDALKKSLEWETVNKKSLEQIIVVAKNAAA